MALGRKEEAGHDEESLRERARASFALGIIFFTLHSFRFVAFAIYIGSYHLYQLGHASRSCAELKNIALHVASANLFLCAQSFSPLGLKVEEGTRRQTTRGGEFDVKVAWRQQRAHMAVAWHLLARTMTLSSGP